MKEKPWRLFRRPARWKRRAAERGAQYDGSRWELKGRYATKARAEGVVRLIVARWSNPSIPMEQFKIMHDNDGRP